MDFEERLAFEIGLESKKLSLRYHAYHNVLHKNHERKKQRLKHITIPPKKVVTPEQWDKSPLFNPFHTHKRRKSIARSISKKIKSNTYTPASPFKKRIGKDGGDYREVSIYQIPDTAVSRIVYKDLLNKNKHRFSSYSYAYRDDRNVHFAIQDISHELKKNNRLFVAEYDFSKFFDSISHKHIFNELQDNGLVVSSKEIEIIKAFLRSHSDHEKGIPQGTSISLFLANIACWKLDKELEKEGLQFARYADDTLIWSTSYSKIIKSSEIISDFSNLAGVKINVKKSDGISLLTSSDMPSELATKKTAISFLGYSISSDSVGIKARSVNKIKRTISYILYKHLIQPFLISGGTPSVPTSFSDEGLLGAMSEIRRYLYGNMSPTMLRNYVTGRSNTIIFKGIMSFYPLVTDTKQMSELDGWLINSVYKAVKKRRALLVKKGPSGGFLRPGTIHHTLNRNDFASQMKRQSVHGKTGLLEVPSFHLIYEAIQRAVEEKGLFQVMNPKSNAYDY